jgi:hypothetical protein
MIDLARTTCSKLLLRRDAQLERARNYHSLNLVYKDMMLAGVGGTLVEVLLEAN